MSISPSDSNNSIISGEKCCAVCEQPNARNNFGTLSCNACAAFFRRTVIQGRRYLCQCAYYDDPSVSSLGEKNLRDCKFCRFEKCLQVGMREKSIRSMEVWKWRSGMSRVGRNFPKPLPKATKEEQMITKPIKTEPNDEDVGNLPDTKFIKKIIFTEEMLETGTLFNFLLTEEKIQRIHNSRSRLSEDVIKRISQRKWNELVETQDNLLAKADAFEPKAPPVHDHGFFLSLPEETGVWYSVPELYIRDLMTSIGFAKSLPFFSKLDFSDQCTILCSQALPAIDLFVCFYSMQIGAKSISASNGVPLINLFKLKRYERDSVVLSLAEKVYCQGISHMLAVVPSRAEFVYLLALMFTNPAIAGLSPEGQKLLQEESEKYSRALLRLQQREHGDAMGALRYANTLRLVANSILNAQKHRELVVYLDTVHDNGRFNALMPKALIPFSIMGRCAQ